jgi:hypothetical protein
LHAERLVISLTTDGWLIVWLQAIGSGMSAQPRVSNDNPYSESLFRTLMYRAQWPSSGFVSLGEAGDCVQNFVGWYNKKSKHSKINFITPAQRHAGKGDERPSNRTIDLEAASKGKPLRWSKGVRHCDPVACVSINPDEVGIKKVKAA